MVTPILEYSRSVVGVLMYNEQKVARGVASLVMSSGVNGYELDKLLDVFDRGEVARKAVRRIEHDGRERLQTLMRRRRENDEPVLAVNDGAELFLTFGIVANFRDVLKGRRLELEDRLKDLARRHAGRMKLDVARLRLALLILVV